jgi:hypothetical protein
MALLWVTVFRHREAHVLRTLSHTFKGPSWMSFTPVQWWACLGVENVTVSSHNQLSSLRSTVFHLLDVCAHSQVAITLKSHAPSLFRSRWPWMIGVSRYANESFRASFLRLHVTVPVYAPLLLVSSGSLPLKNVYILEPSRYRLVSALVALVVGCVSVNTLLCMTCRFHYQPCL